MCCFLHKLELPQTNYIFLEFLPLPALPPSFTPSLTQCSPVPAFPSFISPPPYPPALLHPMLSPTCLPLPTLPPSFTPSLTQCSPVPAFPSFISPPPYPPALLHSMLSPTCLPLLHFSPSLPSRPPSLPPSLNALPYLPSPPSFLPLPALSSSLTQCSPVPASRSFISPPPCPPVFPHSMLSPTCLPLLHFSPSLPSRPPSLPPSLNALPYLPPPPSFLPLPTLPPSLTQCSPLPASPPSFLPFLPSRPPSLNALPYLPPAPSFLPFLPSRPPSLNALPYLPPAPSFLPLPTLPPSLTQCSPLPASRSFISPPPYPPALPHSMLSPTCLPLLHFSPSLPSRPPSLPPSLNALPYLPPAPSFLPLPALPSSLTQCSPLPERSTIDMVFSLRQLQEKCREQHLLYPCTSLTLISQRRLIWSAETASPKDRLLTQTAQHDRVFPHWHEGNSAVQWQLLGAIRNPQRRQTRSPPLVWPSTPVSTKSSCTRHLHLQPEGSGMVETPWSPSHAMEWRPRQISKTAGDNIDGGFQHRPRPFPLEANHCCSCRLHALVARALVSEWVKQGCVLAPTLFSIFFGMLLKHAFDTTTEGIYLRTQSDGRLFNLTRLRAMTKVRKVLIRDMLFADDATVATTPRRNSSHGWTASLRPVRTSDWPSVWRRRMSWDRTQKHRRSLPSTTRNSMLSASSPTSAPPSLTTSPSTQRYTRGLGRQLQLSPVSRIACGQAPSCLWRQRWQSTMPVLSTYCCMVARHGLRMPGRREGWTHSTWEDSAVSWEYPGTTKLPTLMSCLVLAFPVYTLCLDNADCDGWVMSAVWMMVAFQKTSSMVRWNHRPPSPAI